MASPAAAAPPASRPASARLLSLAFASSVGIFLWSLVGGGVYLLAIHGSLPLGGDPLLGARLRAARSDLAGAIQQYRMAALIDSREPRALKEMATLLQQHGRHEQAAAVLEELLRVRPDDLRALNAAGDISLAQGRYADAIGFYLRVLQDSRDEPAVLNNLGTAYAHSGDLDRAIQAFSAALALAPEGIARANLERAKALKAGASPAPGLVRP